MKLLHLLISIPFITFATSIKPSIYPPNNISVDDVPLFVVIGSDDNYGNSMPDFLDYFKNLKNPKGIGNVKTFDGTPARMSFYSNTVYKTENWMSWHERAINDGHELGLHTDGHPHISSTDQAINEIETNLYQMCENGSFNRSDFTGFRSPYLDVSNHVLNALDYHGLRYDCSLEEGMQPDSDPRYFNWPYTLDNGTNEAWRYLFDVGAVRDTILPHPGLWEIPAYPLAFIPESLYSEYNLSSGYDNKTANSNLEPWNFGEINESVDGTKVTGLDYDAWYPQQWGGWELAATLIYNLKLRLEGNRCPLTFGIHSNYYSNSDYFDGFTTFIDSALTFDAVRVVTANQLVDWLEDPYSLSGNIVESKYVSNNFKNDVVEVSLINSKLTMKLNEEGSGKYQLLSANGKVIDNGFFKKELVINCNMLSSGVYFVNLTFSGKNITHKINLANK